jgi:hypothetical protein
MRKTLLILLCFFSAPSISAQVTTLHNFEFTTVKLEKITPPLRDLPGTVVDPADINHRVERENPSLEHFMPYVNKHALPVGADPALQKEKTIRDSSTSINILSNWEGLSANVDPSDNCLAVGPDHVFQLTNNSTSTFMRIWDKSGNLLVNNTKVQTLSGVNDCGDPNIIYDEQADRYIFLVLYSCSGNNKKLLLCASQTGDPTGAYYVYTIEANNGFPDYPKIAVWGNSYFITTNSNSPTIWALNRTEILDGTSLGTVQKFPLSSFPSIGFQSASPVSFSGITDIPADEPAIMLRVADDAWGGNIDSDHLEIFTLEINWLDSTLSAISGPFDLATLDYNSYLCGFNSLNCIPQPNSNKKLDPLGNIIMDKVRYRNFSDYETIVCTHVVNADGDGKAGVRWYELRRENGGLWHTYQESTFSPDSVNRWMSSIAINEQGTIALGYNVASGTTYPGSRITGRGICDEVNMMTAEETVSIDGLASSNSNRYGDYNGMVADPSDGSFWFTSQYNPTGSWSTNVTHFTITPCIATQVTDAASLLPQVTVVPVPAADQIEISVQGDHGEVMPIQIVDLAGKVRLSQTINHVAGISKTVVDVHHLENGFYLLKVKTTQGMSVQRIIVEH